LSSFLKYLIATKTPPAVLYMADIETLAVMVRANSKTTVVMVRAGIETPVVMVTADSPIKL
jgi:hypothetical protein